MASAYKWRITNTKYAFITDASGGDPFITVKLDEIDENAISLATNQLNEANYESKYNKMCTLIHADIDGKYLSLPNYTYYYNIDNSSNCAVINYGIQGTAGTAGTGIANITQKKSGSVNTISFILTDGTSYNVTINDGESGVQGVTGPTGASGLNGNDTTVDEATVRRIVENMNITSDVTAAVLTTITPSITDINTKVAYLQDEVSQYSAYYVSLINGFKEVSIIANNANQLATQLQTDVNGLSSNYSGNTSSLLTMKGTVSELVKTMKNMTDTVNSLSATTVEAKTNVDELREIVVADSALTMTFSGVTEMINERLGEYGVRISGNEKNIDLLQTGVSTLSNKAESYDQDIPSLKYSVNTLYASAMTMDKKIEEYGKATSTAVTYVEKLLSNSGMTKDDVQTMISKDTKEINTRLEEYNQRITVNTQDISLLQIDVKALNEKTEPYGNRFSAMEYTIGNLNISAVTTNKNVESLSALTESSVTYIDKFLECSAITRDDVQTMISDATKLEFSTFNSKINTQSDRVDGIEKNYSTLNNKVTNYLDPNVDELLGSVASITTSIKTVSGVCVNLDTRVTVLENK